MLPGVRCQVGHLEHGEAECPGLAAAGLRRHEDIPAPQDQGDRLRLGKRRRRSRRRSRRRRRKSTRRRRGINWWVTADKPMAA